MATSCEQDNKPSPLNPPPMTMEMFGTFSGPSVDFAYVYCNKYDLFDIKYSTEDRIELDTIMTRFSECDVKLDEAELEIKILRNSVITIVKYIAKAHNNSLHELHRRLTTIFTHLTSEHRRYVLHSIYNRLLLNLPNKILLKHMNVLKELLAWANINC